MHISRYANVTRGIGDPFVKLMTNQTPYPSAFEIVERATIDIDSRKNMTF